MTDLLWRFLAKCRRGLMIGLILAGLGGLFCLTVDQVVKRFVHSLTGITAERLKVKVSLKGVHYAFPRQIILEDLKVSDIKPGSSLMLEIPRVVLDFTFPLLSKKSKIHLDQVSFYRAGFYLPAMKNYLMSKGALLWEELRFLPASDIKITLTDIRLYLFKNSKTEDPLVLSLEFALNNGQFAIKTKDNHLFLQSWGNWQDNRINWKGFMFYNGPLFKGPLYVLDIDGQAFVKSKDVSLKKLSFSINGNQFAASGHGLLEIPFKFETNISYRKQLRHITVQDPLIGMDAVLNGQLDHRGLLLNGRSDFDLFSNEKIHMPLERMGLEFKGLQTSIINDRLLRLKIKQGQALLLTYKSEYKIPFDNFLASIRRKGQAQFLAALSTRLYGGKYEGRMVVDTALVPWQMEASGKLEHLDINRLSHLVKYFDKSKGYLSGTFTLQAPDHLTLKASLSMHEGDFADFSFLPVAVSKLFQMPSLDHLSNADVLIRLKLDRDAADIENFKLHSDHLNLDGSFRLDSNNLVLSRISVFFPKAVLSESPVGQKVLQLVPQAWQMPFEFHLSGDLQKMNFQWDDSPLKRKIEQFLPNFVERSIERHVEDRAAI